MHLQTLSVPLSQALTASNILSNTGNLNILFNPVLMDAELALINCVTFAAIAQEQMVDDGVFHFVELQLQEVQVGELREGQVAVAVDQVGVSGEVLLEGSGFSGCITLRREVEWGNDALFGCLWRVI